MFNGFSSQSIQTMQSDLSDRLSSLCILYSNIIFFVELKWQGEVPGESFVSRLSCKKLQCSSSCRTCYFKHDISLIWAGTFLKQPSNLQRKKICTHKNKVLFQNPSIVPAFFVCFDKKYLVISIFN